MIDWTHIYNDYKGKWVAIKSDHKTVVASGKTAVEASTLAEKAVSYTHLTLPTM
jgi:predicted RNase H-like HicB family nuclease